MQAWVDTEALLEVGDIAAWHDAASFRTPGFKTSLTLAHRVRYTTSLWIFSMLLVGSMWSESFGPSDGGRTGNGMISANLDTLQHAYGPLILPTWTMVLLRTACESPHRQFSVWHETTKTSRTFQNETSSRISYVLCKTIGYRHTELCTMDPRAWELAHLATDRFSSWRWVSMRGVCAPGRRAMSLRRRFDVSSVMKD